MKFLIISDLHAQVENLEKLESQFKESDAVLFAGDFAKFAHTETGLPSLEKLCKMHETIFSVTGNCDETDFINETEKRDISVEKQLVSFEGLMLTGSGGGSKFTGTTPNERTDEELYSDLHLVTEQGEQEWNNLIVLMHNPPKDTECDKISNGMHVGSPLLKEFIEKYQPLLVVTGHIHESAGICKVGKSTVVNPGALLEGKYATCEIIKTNGEWELKNLELKTL